MKNYYQSTVDLIKDVISDKISLYFIGVLIIIFLADFEIWRERLRYEDIYIFSLNGVYPIRFLAIILLINSILAIFSFQKEKEISYLLFGASIFIATLILILEIFYLVNLSYG